MNGIHFKLYTSQPIYNNTYFISHTKKIEYIKHFTLTSQSAMYLQYKFTSSRLLFYSIFYLTVLKLKYKILYIYKNIMSESECGTRNYHTVYMPLILLYYTMSSSPFDIAIHMYVHLESLIYVIVS